MQESDEVLGFSFEARRGDNSSLCLALLVAISDEVQAEGHLGKGGIPELRKRYIDVIEARRACPLAGTCKRMRRALSKGAKIRSLGYRQGKLL